MMETIQMVDLQREYAELKTEIDRAIQRVLHSAYFIKGPEVTNFAEELAEWLNVKYVIPCGNGTDALQIAMMALDLQPGDEVIIPSFTYVATAEVIALLKLTPVFVDVDPHTFNIDVNQIESAISSKTKAIVPVHLFGQSAHMEAIMQLAGKYGLYVIEDNAQAIGAEYSFSDGQKKSTGTIGHFGTTSFFPSKNLGCYGDGGALTTNDSALAKKAALIANHGQSELYMHERIGVNSRLDAMQAAILRVKLRHLNTHIKMRQRIAQVYDQAFSDLKRIQTPLIDEYSSHVYHQYTLKLNDVDRKDFQKSLKENGILTKVYYPLPLHAQKAYKNFRLNTDKLQITEDLCSRVLSLPISPYLDLEQQAHIIKKIKIYCQ
jgi:UDP-2-acetamido-2-deoxy-ribo-hexuluronate aminotransferase